MTCNEGGPTNLERDILPNATIKEVIEGAEPSGESEFFLSLVPVLVRNTLA
ncbi:Glycosyl-phosphatidylinositol-anchored molecule-like protein [Manis javanica]|nr:Glycosyl-phosphatidylinositol-anchored molecule-like protein [Manis javanica]